MLAEGDAPPCEAAVLAEFLALKLAYTFPWLVFKKLEFMRELMEVPQLSRRKELLVLVDDCRETLCATSFLLAPAALAALLPLALARNC